MIEDSDWGPDYLDGPVQDPNLSMTVKDFAIHFANNVPGETSWHYFGITFMKGYRSTMLDMYADSVDGSKRHVGSLYPKQAAQLIQWLIDNK